MNLLPIDDRSVAASTPASIGCPADPPPAFPAPSLCARILLRKARRHAAEQAATEKEKGVRTERWLTPGARSASLACSPDLGHEIPTALLLSVLTSSVGALAAALGGCGAGARVRARARRAGRTERELDDCLLPGLRSSSPSLGSGVALPRRRSMLRSPRSLPARHAAHRSVWSPRRNRSATLRRAPSRAPLLDARVCAPCVPAARGIDDPELPRGHPDPNAKTPISVELCETRDVSPLDKSTAIDIFTPIDMGGNVVISFFKRVKAVAVEFCERCSQVCDKGCRQAALRDRSLVSALRYGARI